MPAFTRSKALAAAHVGPLVEGEPRALVQVMYNDDLYQQIIKRFNIKTLTKLATLSCEHAEDAKILFKTRITRYTRPFFVGDDDHTVFFHTLEDSESWIVADVPLAVVSVLSDPPVPDELHVIASHFQDEAWARFMVNTLGYDLAYDEPAKGRFDVVGDRQMAFKHPKVPGKTIVFTTSADNNIFHLFLAGRHTGHLNAIAAYKVITANMEMTAEQTAIESYPYDGRPSRTPFPKMVSIRRSTSHWTRPCGITCPARYRFSKGLEGFGHWNWGGVDELGWGSTDPTLIKLGEADIKWRTNEKCTNVHCKYGWLNV
ncbi:hypothetical protein C8J57DRAFT_1508501 [Mycena rebaudengoi]|nr:hypothetical protein C8J57DRAFT_1508501 [Mycena rebaudengoi]